MTAFTPRYIPRRTEADAQELADRFARQDQARAALVDEAVAERARLRQQGEQDAPPATVKESIWTRLAAAEQDAPPATVTITYASGRKYVYQVADETRADELRRVLSVWPTTRLEMSAT